MSLDWLESRTLLSASIAGTLWQDLNRNGLRDSFDRPRSHWRVYDDRNNNARRDKGETAVMTDASGRYKFKSLAAGVYRIREVLPSGYELAKPASGVVRIKLKAGQTVSGRDFINVNAARVLLRDTFDVSANVDDTNFELAARQTGQLTPLSYSESGPDVFQQVGNGGAPNALLLACRAAGESGAVSLNHDFTESPGAGQAFVIEFDVNPVQTGDSNFNVTQNSWCGIDFGASAGARNRFVNQTDGVGILFRGTGQSDIWHNGSDISPGDFAPAADDTFHHIRIEVTDAADGNPFNGDAAPITIRAFADGSKTPFLNYTAATNFSSNYISLVGEGEGGGGDGVVRHAVDNLIISVAAPL